MRLEAIIPCVNYSDFLDETLVVSRGVFDRILVVTDSGDADTRAVCAKWNIECLTTPAYFENGNRFSRSGGINAGITHLDLDGAGRRTLHADAWLAVMDADIVLPPVTTRVCLQMLGLDPACIYGLDRMMCESYEVWEKFAPSLRVPDPSFTEVHLRVGKRLGPIHKSGWVPMGYFQLWNPQGSTIRHYPFSADASMADWNFALHWPRNRRIFIPELVAVHLDSQPSPFGVNWRGRRTPKFAPRPKSKAEYEKAVADATPAKAAR